MTCEACGRPSAAAFCADCTLLGALCVEHEEMWRELPPATRRERTAEYEQEVVS